MPTSTGFNMPPVSKGLSRLNQLFFLLGSVPRGKISLESWRMQLSAKTATVTDDELMSNDCGTVACAVGYACANSVFNKEGLSWNSDNNVPCYIDPDQPDGKEFRRGSWPAVCLFFQMVEVEARSLFECVTTAEYRLLPGWTQRDVVRKRLHDYLTKHGLLMSVFQRVDI